jgi:hypothetical protein
MSKNKFAQKLRFYASLSTMQKLSLSNYKAVIFYKWVILKNTLVAIWFWINGVYKQDMWLAYSGLCVLIGLLSQSNLYTCEGRQ